MSDPRDRALRTRCPFHGCEPIGATLREVTYRCGVAVPFEDVKPEALALGGEVDRVRS